MLELLTRRARREDQRVERFLLAIKLSDRYALDPSWELQTVTDEEPRRPWPAGVTDTAAFPAIILAGTVL